MMITLNFKLSKATLCKSIKTHAENEFNRFLLWKEKFQVLTKSIVTATFSMLLKAITIH